MGTSCVKRLISLFIVSVTDPYSLALYKKPGHCGADMVVGEGSSFGNPVQFGGPGFGFFASRKEFLRQMPGRLCGETVDKDGKRSYVLTLNTREQHIRREKATSNICTNQGLFALAFTIHMSLLGEIGFKKLARLNHEKACLLADRLEQIKDVKILSESFFNEFAIELPVSASNMVEKLAANGIIAGYPLDGGKLLLAATEMVSEEDIERLVRGIEDYIQSAGKVAA